MIKAFSCLFATLLNLTATGDLVLLFGINVPGSSTFLPNDLWYYQSFDTYT